MSRRPSSAPSFRDIRFPAAAIAAIAQGQTIAAIKQVREANDLDLRMAKEAVDAYIAGNREFTVLLSASPEPDERRDGFPREAEAALAHGQTIEAIKIVREKYRVGLKEAKDLVDAQRRLPARPGAPPSPTISRDRTDWPRILAVAAIAACGVALWWWQRAA
ncbi:hypothetical protein [Pseudoxanthomonas wuyuanensis]